MLQRIRAGARRGFGKLGHFGPGFGGLRICPCQQFTADVQDRAPGSCFAINLTCADETANAGRHADNFKPSSSAKWQRMFGSL